MSLSKMSLSSQAPHLHPSVSNPCTSATTSNLQNSPPLIPSTSQIPTHPYFNISLSFRISSFEGAKDEMDIRLLRPSDIPHVQQANITNLPENYFCKYYMYHALTWPQLSYVAVDVSLMIFFSVSGFEASGMKFRDRRKTARWQKEGREKEPLNADNGRLSGMWVSSWRLNLMRRPGEF